MKRKNRGGNVEVDPMGRDGVFRPEDFGIHIGNGPDVILGRDYRNAESPPPRDAQGNIMRRFPPDAGYLALEQLSDFAPATLSWLWPGKVPLARLTLLAGESQVGKSLVALDLAARVSRGGPWAADSDSGPMKPGNALILGMHYAAIGDTVAHLTRVGADLSRLFFADGVLLPDTSEEGWKRSISLADDLDCLDKTIHELSISLVIIDPLWAFTGARGQKQALRIAELALMAKESGAAVLGVADLLRDNRGRGSLRVKGERALNAVAHTVLGIVPHPEDAEMRVLLPLKTDPAEGTANGKFGLEFLVAAGQIAWDSQPSPLTVEAVLSAERFGGELESVAEWLRALLSRGSLPAKEVFANARQCGISIGTLKRAKATIGVRVEQVGDSKNWHWVWSLEGALGIEGNSPESASIDEITCAPGQKAAEFIEIAPAPK